MLCYGFSRYINHHNSENYFQSILNYSLSIGFGTFVIYSISDIKNFLKNKLLIFLCLLSSIFGGFFFLLSDLDANSVLILIFSFVTSFVYVTPPSSYKFDIRGIPSIKILIIAFVWIITCLIVPTLNTPFSLPWMHLASVFLFFISIIIPFDIRDIRTDNPALKTFPQLFGIKKSKRLALTTIAISLGLVFFEEMSLTFKLLYGLNALFVILLIAFMNKIIHNKIYFLLLDGTVFVLGLAYFFA